MAALFDGLRFPKLTPRYNICPTQPVLCVRQSSSGENESVHLRWGLVPFWAKDLKMGARMINARSETVATKPSFRAAFESRRCLVFADGFEDYKPHPRVFMRALLRHTHGMALMRDRHGIASRLSTLPLSFFSLSLRLPTLLL